MLQAIIQLSQLRSLAVCEGALCIRQQLHGSSQASVVLIVVRGELQHVPAPSTCLATETSMASKAVFIGGIMITMMMMMILYTIASRC